MYVSLLCLSSTVFCLKTCGRRSVELMSNPLKLQLVNVKTPHSVLTHGASIAPTGAPCLNHG
jgi:hypothetical protein